MARPLFRIAALTIALTLISAVTASATVRVSRDSANRLLITDISSVNDEIRIQGGGASPLAIISKQPLSRSSSASTCSSPAAFGSSFRTTCPGSGIPSMVVGLGAGADTYTDTRPVAGVSGTSGSPTTVSGGDGNDVFTTSNVDVQSIFTIQGGAGTDTYSVATQDQDGIMVRDRATTDVDTGAGFGIADVVDVESYRTGSGPDVISGSALPTTAAPRRYDGAVGPDSLIGSPLADTLIGGQGSDILLGGDGNDLLDGKAGELTAMPDHRFDCGAGTDTASIDLTDAEPAGCETVNRSAIGEGPHVEADRPKLRRNDSVRVKLRCPAAAEHACAGDLTAAFKERRLGKADPVGYRVQAGSARRVRLVLENARKGRKVVLRSTEPGDVLGVKTTTVRTRLG